MAPKTLLPTEEPDAAAPPQSAPLDVSGIEGTGAMRFGVRVVRAVLTMADGREVTVDLPTPGPPAKDWTRTKAGRAILDVLAREGHPMKGESIAKLAGYAYNGSFRSALKGLEKQGEISHTDDDGYELA